MSPTGPIHWFGCLLLFIAAILLMITTITAPIVNNLAIMRITLGQSVAQAHGYSDVTFGTFGWCQLQNDVTGGGNACSARMVGYRPSIIAQNAIGGSSFDSTAANVADGLTNAMVLHPVACAIAFLAFLVSLGAGWVGSLIGFVIAAIAWILTLVVMAIDFTLFAIIRNHVNGNNSDASAGYSTGMWCVLAAFILLFLGALIVLFTCCSARLRKRREARHTNTEVKTDYGAPVGGRRSRWGRWRR